MYVLCEINMQKPILRGARIICRRAVRFQFGNEAFGMSQETKDGSVQFEVIHERQHFEVKGSSWVAPDGSSKLRVI